MFLSPEYRVYVHDTDVAGVVHHSNYLRYFEAGRIEFLRELGFPYIDFQNQGIGFVPVTIHTTYHKPLRQDDTYQVGVVLQTLKKASFVVHQTILCNNAPYVEATIKLACVKEPAFKPVGLPKALQGVLGSAVSKIYNE